MSSGTLEPVFKSREVALAALLAILVESGILLLWIYAGAGNVHVNAAALEAPKEIPIAVKPVMDDAPLLKLGGKKKAKLPDMWKKQAPVQRFEETSAPSAKAAKTPEAIPSSKLTPLDASAPPPDADIAKQVDTPVPSALPSAAPTVEGEGVADGAKEGTETDPLKGRAVDAYRAKIIGWFVARFHAPKDEIPCEELKTLRATVQVQFSGQTVSGYTLVKPSGNSIFDAKVRSTLDGLRGEDVPPPPPLYPDILRPTETFTYTGPTKCQ
jgi:hypothetical protein